MSNTAEAPAGHPGAHPYGFADPHWSGRHFGPPLPLKILGVVVAFWIFKPLGVRGARLSAVADRRGATAAAASAARALIAPRSGVHGPGQAVDLRRKTPPSRSAVRRR